MAKFFYLFFIIFFSLVSCRDKFPPEEPNNYRITWGGDSSSIVLQDFHEDLKPLKSQLGSYTIIRLDRAIGNRAWVSRESSKILLTTTDTVVPAKQHKYILGEIPKCFSEGPYYHFPEPVDALENNLYDEKYEGISIEKLNIGNISIRSNDSLDINVNKTRSTRFEITGSSGTRKYPLNLTFQFTDSSSHKHVIIEDKTIAFIGLYQHVEKLSLINCQVVNIETSIFSNMQPDTIELNNLAFKGLKAKLSLYNLPNRNSSKRIILMCEGTDISRISFDYSHFNYYTSPGVEKYYKNSWYSADKKSFAAIIQNQRLDNNEGGKTKGQIDSSKYEDRQHLLGFLEIPIKSWWNNYGFEKETVVSSALTLFVVFTFINFAFFHKVIECYGFQEIIDGYNRLKNQKPSFNRFVERLFLCFVYSSYLFFGLKLDVDKLKLVHRGAAFWIMVQYVTGIISLAYVANLIIGK